MEISSLEGRQLVEVVSDETRVVLIGTAYTPEPAEPVYGSRYACVGTIRKIFGKDSDYNVAVDWDNGESNAYLVKDLRVVKSLASKNPNFTYKIWRKKYGRQ